MPIVRRFAEFLHDLQQLEGTVARGDAILDAFTRHLDPKFKQRGVQVLTDERQHKQVLIGGRVNRFIPNPTFDPVARPGCQDAAVCRSRNSRP